MGQGIISRSNPGNTGDKVGDIRITTRDSLGSKWALCNGEEIPSDADWSNGFGTGDLMDPSKYSRFSVSFCDPTSYDCRVFYIKNNIFFMVGIQNILDSTYNDIHYDQATLLSISAYDAQTGAVYSDIYSRIFDATAVDSDSKCFVDIACSASKIFILADNSDICVYYIYTLDIKDDCKGIIDNDEIQQISYIGSDVANLTLYAIDDEYYLSFLDSADGCGHLYDNSANSITFSSDIYCKDLMKLSNDVIYCLCSDSGPMMHLYSVDVKNGDYDNIYSSGDNYTELRGIQKIADNKFAVLWYYENLSDSCIELKCMIYDASTNSITDNKITDINISNVVFYYNDYIYTSSGDASTGLVKYDLSGNYNDEVALEFDHSGILGGSNDLYYTNCYIASNYDEGWHVFRGDSNPLPTISVDDESYCFIKIYD